MDQYTKLSDCKHFEDGDAFEIWYMRPEFFSDFITGDTSKLDRANLEKTHILLGQAKNALILMVTKEAHDADPDLSRTIVLEHLYRNLQGEVWSPNGEACDLIESKGLSHTSLSMGDIVRFKDGSVWICAAVGWLKVKDKNE